MLSPRIKAPSELGFWLSASQGIAESCSTLSVVLRIVSLLGLNGAAACVL